MESHMRKVWLHLFFLTNPVSDEIVGKIKLSSFYGQPVSEVLNSKFQARNWIPLGSSKLSSIRSGNSSNGISVK